MVSNVPAEVGVLDITSQETTCDAYGFGYLRKKASVTMDQGSLNGRRSD